MFFRFLSFLSFFFFVVVTGAVLVHLFIVWLTCVEVLFSESEVS